MKEEEGRHIAAMKAFQVADKSLQELKKRLQEEENKENTRQLLLKMLKSKPRVKGCCCIVLRTSWPPPGPKLLH